MVIKGADYLIDGASSLAKHMHVSEIDLRKNFKVTVLAIKSVSPKLNTLNPSANARISANDVLIVFGEVGDIEILDETMNHS